MDKLLVVLGALLFIGLIAWWFFGKRKSSSSTLAEVSNGKQRVEITVQGGYKPGSVTLAKDIPAELVFIRKDASACFEEVILPDFGIKTDLPVNKPFVVKVDPKQAGEFQYSCGMHMFFGKIVVK